MTRAGDDDDSDAAAAFWRDRAARMRAIAHGGSSGASADDDGDARGNHLGLVALQRADVEDAHRRARAAASTSTWMTMEYPSLEERDARATRAQLAEAVTVCLERAKARRAARAAQPTTTRTLTPENALDGAATVDGLREGYKRLLREVTARHARTREALEEEIATLRARVEALETSSKKNERTTPTKERLIALAYDEDDAGNNNDDADDDIACELSPFSASERTPPLRLREDDDEEDADVETPRAFRPPRPPKNGNENDKTFDANIAPPPLPAVRPGQGYVCPFSGKVLLKTP